MRPNVRALRDANGSAITVSRTVDTFGKPPTSGPVPTLCAKSQMDNPTPTDEHKPPQSVPVQWNWRPKLRWFAAEYLIVVLGVLTAVGLNAWWQGQQDIGTEDAYLHQIAADLDATVALMAQVDEVLAPSERAADRLFESFRTPEPLSADSVLVWVSVSTTIQNVNPVVGTAEALVTTGDLALIRNDSLRSAIPAYLEQQQSLLSWQAEVMDLAVDAITAITRHVDLVEADAALVAAGGLLVIPRPGVYAADSVTSSPPPFPFDARRFQRDQDAYHNVYMLGLAKIQARNMRQQIALAASDLRLRIEAKLNR